MKHASLESLRPDIETLDRLHAATTEGEWHLDEDGDVYSEGSLGFEFISEFAELPNAVCTVALHNEYTKLRAYIWELEHALRLIKE
jgi:hypothetical protein